jgi:hypothetical protein
MQQAAILSRFLGAKMRVDVVVEVPKVIVRADQGALVLKGHEDIEAFFEAVAEARDEWEEALFRQDFEGGVFDE